MNNYNFRIVVFFIFSNIFLIRGQQELSFNHYMFNSQLFNPAFVGLDESIKSEEELNEILNGLEAQKKNAKQVNALLKVIELSRWNNGKWKM